MNIRQKKIFLLVLFIIVSICLNCGFNNNKPENIIILIGDGMGVAQITAAKTVRGSLHMENFKHVALATTHALDQYLTDSAAAATAIATGYRTNNGHISVLPDNTPLRTVLQEARDRGKKTGLVATASITHATPAAFAAHVPSRTMQTEIADHLVENGVDVLFGGGLRYFVPGMAENGRPADAVNLIDRLEKTHTIALSEEEFRQIGETERAAAFFASGHPPDAESRKISLNEMTEKAIQILSKSKNGFFLMAEGSQIDWRGHDNLSQGIINETIDFDDAVGTAYAFAKANQRTLVIVTADHETGGYALHGGSIEEKTVTAAGFTTTGHTGTMVPVLAFGPGSENFKGFIDLSDIGKNIMRLLK